MTRPDYHAIARARLAYRWWHRLTCWVGIHTPVEEERTVPVGPPWRDERIEIRCWCGSIWSFRRYPQDGQPC